MRNFVWTSTVSTSELQALQNRIQIFGILRTVCGILAIIFFLLSVLLFWRLGIWNALLQRTGIAKKKSISQMQQVNASSHRLTKSSAEKLAEQEFTGQLTGDRKKEKKSKKTGEIKATAPIAAPDKSENETSVLTQPIDTSPQFAGKFILTVNQQIIHTDEIIREVE